MTLKEKLYSLATRPVELLVRRWNWKAAIFSSLIWLMGLSKHRRVKSALRLALNEREAIEI